MKNRIKNLLALTAISLIGWCACTGEKINNGSPNGTEPNENASRLTEESVEASGPYFTYDPEGHPVLCWTERMNDDGDYVLKYSVFNTAEEAFGDPVVVKPSMGTRAHPESMNKVAFKTDGTVVALFGLKHPTPDNPFAGSILQTISSDKGENWSDAAFLHSDTLPGYGRAYFDIAILPDGELGAVWLGGRKTESETGSALFFAKTEQGKGFGKDHQIGESTCECCRTDLYTDQNGRIHVAFRDITFNASQMGKQVRDMAYSYSDDLGNSFTEPKVLSEDKWAIEGCPHTGPSLATDGQGLHALWFTDGGGTGIYYTRSKDNGEIFSPRELVSRQGRHPNMTTLANGKLVMVWDEIQSSKVKIQANLTGMQQHGEKHSPAEGGSKIMLQLREGDKKNEMIVVSDEGSNHASHPVVTALNQNKVLVAWTQELLESTAIYYKIIPAE